MYIHVKYKVECKSNGDNDNKQSFIKLVNFL